MGGCFSVMEKINKEDNILDRNVNVIKDINGNNVVLIKDIIFKGKRQIKWDDVKDVLDIKKETSNPFES